MDSISRWLSVEEIALHLGISKESVYRWLDDKKIPAYRVGRQWKFQISEIDAWVRRGGAMAQSACRLNGSQITEEQVGNA